jgi:signal peptidase II
LSSLRSSLKNWAILIGLALVLLALDQVTKWLVQQNLAVGEAWAPIPALTKIFTVTHVRNTGVAFGTLPGLGWLFMFVNLAVLIAVFILYPRIPQGLWYLRVAAALILAGDLGNLMNRLHTAFLAAGETGSIWTALPYAYVTDFMDFKIWPVWNMADLYVVSGVTILAIWIWRTEQKTAKEAVAEKN